MSAPSSRTTYVLTLELDVGDAPGAMDRNTLTSLLLEEIERVLLTEVAPTTSTNYQRASLRLVRRRKAFP